jgi:hypothetical protein
VEITTSAKAIARAYQGLDDRTRAGIRATGSALAVAAFSAAASNELLSREFPKSRLGKLVMRFQPLAFCPGTGAIEVAASYVRGPLMDRLVIGRGRAGRFGAAFAITLMAEAATEFAKMQALKLPAVRVLDGHGLDAASKRSAAKFHVEQEDLQAQSEAFAASLGDLVAQGFFKEGQSLNLADLAAAKQKLDEENGAGEPDEYEALLAEGIRRQPLPPVISEDSALTDTPAGDGPEKTADEA